MTSRNGWRRIKFGEMAENVATRIDDPSQAGVERYVGLEHLDPGSLSISRWGQPTDVEATKLRFWPGDVIFGRRRAYQRKLAVADFEGICSAHALVLRAKPDVALPEFLPLFMQSDLFFDRALAISVGSLSPTINWKTLKEQEFDLPPVAEQREIAELLWACERHYRGMLRTQSALSNAFSRFLSKSFRDHSSKAVRLADVGAWLSGGTPSKSKPEYWDGVLPWASPKDMKLDVLFDTEEHLTAAGAGAENGTRVVDPGTIFVVVRGMILAHSFPVARAGVRMAFNQDMKALVVSDDFLPEFVFLWLKTNRARCLSLVADSSHGTKRLPTDRLLDLKIPAPSIADQHAFMGRAQRFLDGEDALEQQLASARSLRRELMRTELAA